MIRTLACLLVSFAVGAFAFQGEETDDLRRRVRALADRLRAEADRKEPRIADRKPVDRLYEIADLVRQPGFDPRPRHLDLVPSQFVPPAEPEVDAALVGLGTESLEELIRASVAPSLWVDVEGADLTFIGERMFVRQVPAVHDRVRAMLAYLRPHVNRRAGVEIVAVRVAKEHRAWIAEPTRELTPEQADRLLAAEPLARLRIDCLEGRRASGRSGRVHDYVADYDVQIAQEGTIGDPQTVKVAEGCTATVQVAFDDAANGARLELRLDRSELELPHRTRRTEHGPLPLPRMRLTRVRTGIWAPLGRMVVAGGSPDCLFLVRVDRSSRR